MDSASFQDLREADPLNELQQKLKAHWYKERLVGMLNRLEYQRAEWLPYERDKRRSELLRMLW